MQITVPAAGRQRSIFYIDIQVHEHNKKVTLHPDLFKLPMQSAKNIYQDVLI